MAKRKRLDTSRAEQESQLAEIRRLESELTKARSALKSEQKLRKHAEEELESAAGVQDVIESTRGRVRGTPVKTSKRKGKPVSTAVIAATDWHAEENVDPEVCNNLNEFNLDICKDRVRKLWEKSLYLLEFTRNVSNVRDVVLWLGGDLMNGHIHEELAESNFLGPSEAILFIQSLVADGVETLKADGDVDSIHVVTSFGNHGRSTKKRHISTGYRHSWEWLAYSNLADRYRDDPKTSWQVEKGYHSYVDIQGHQVRFHHGDGLRYQGGVGGITIPVNKSIAQWNKSRHANYDVFGHWHQYLDTWNWTSCGCLVGYNAYSIEIKADRQEPTQTFMVFDADYGKVLATPIFVGAKG